MRIGKREFQESGHTYVCGILNMTPDSFSDGGLNNTLDKALHHALAMVEEGADLLDIGGESTRPGYTKISDEEEIARILPIIERLKKETDVPLSVDTYKSAVACAAIEAGADLINDIWGLKYDPAMARVIADSDAACCLMHNRTDTNYTSYFENVIEDMRGCLALAEQAGIGRDRILLDPGIGFAKDQPQNRELMRRLKEFCEILDYPVLLGTSRKSLIGTILNVPADQRLAGTIATTIMGVEAGCMFVRVHDVKANADAIKVYETIKNRG